MWSNDSSWRPTAPPGSHSAPQRLAGFAPHLKERRGKCHPRISFPGAIRWNLWHVKGVTTANKITILRVLLIPFFVVETVYYLKSGHALPWALALGSFALAAILDGVDGYVARRFHQISELGTVLDPLADKLLLVSAIIVLSCNHGDRLGQMPLWLTGTILGRDALLVLGWWVIHHFVGQVRVKPRLLGKLATVLQMASVLWLLLHLDTGDGRRWFKICAAAAAICTGVSGVLYVFDGMRQLSAHPSSSATGGPVKPNQPKHGQNR